MNTEPTAKKQRQTNIVIVKNVFIVNLFLMVYEILYYAPFLH